MNKLIVVLTTAIAVVSIIALGFAIMMIENLKERLYIQDNYIRQCYEVENEKVIYN